MVLLLLTVAALSIVVLGVVVVIATHGRSGASFDEPAQRDAAIRKLEERYLHRDITAEEYEERRRRLDPPD